MKTYFEEQMQVINNAVKSLDTETFTQLVTECEAVLSEKCPGVRKICWDHELFWPRCSIYEYEYSGSW